LTIYRDGEKKTLEVSLYNIIDYQVKKIVDFAGGIIFEADDYMSAKTGIPLGSVSMVNVQKGSGLSAVPTFVRYDQNVSYRLVINKLDKQNITNLDSLIALLPNVILKKFVTIDFSNYQPYVESFNSTLQSGHNSMTSDITLDALDIKPRKMLFDYKNGDWVVEEIKGK
jgi:hypothetical protein